MSETPGQPSQRDLDAKSLEQLGYAQQLLRDLGGFQNFALSFSIISILTGAVTLYGYGLKMGGPFEMAVGWPVTPTIVEEAGAKRGAFAAADVAVAASGTVSLELAANGCPMVIAYDMHPLTLWLMRRAALIDTVTLVNLVSETRVVPEFIGERCRADLIAPAVEALLADPSPQEGAMTLVMERLGKGGTPPGLRAAQSVLSVL